MGSSQYLIVQLIEYHMNKKTDLNLSLQMDLNMDSILGLTKEMIWVLQVYHMKDLQMKILMVHLIYFNWGYKTELKYCSIFGISLVQEE